MYKQKCMMVLKKKKQYQNQLTGYLNQMGTLDQITLQNESMKNHQEMVLGLRRR